MEEKELTAEELYQKKIRDEFERLKNLPKTELVLTKEQIQAELELAKQNQYESLIVSKIRQKYTINQELAILRQKEEKPEEYQEYYDYVEQCKQEAKNAINQEQITESISEEREDGNESGQTETPSVSDCLLSKEEIQMIINDESL